MFPINSNIKVRINGFIVTVQLVKYLNNNMIKVTPTNQNKPFKLKSSAIICQV